MELTLDDGEVVKIEAGTRNGYVTGVLESVGQTRIKVEVDNVLRRMFWIRMLTWSWTAMTRISTNWKRAARLS